MKDKILADMGYVDDPMLEAISGSTDKTRDSWRKHGKLKYIRYGTECLYPIRFLSEELAARCEKKYGTAPDPVREIL